MSIKVLNPYEKQAGISCGFGAGTGVGGLAQRTMGGKDCWRAMRGETVSRSGRAL
jgi:hypothetical protein